MAVVLGDSLLRHLPDNPKFSKVVFPGIDCAALSEEIVNGHLDSVLRNASLIIVLVGTNDIPCNFPRKVAIRVVSIGTLIQARFRGARVALSGILPRPEDKGLYSLAIKQTNKLIEEFCVGTNLVNLRRYKAFLSHNQPTLHHFSIDGLHLSEPGITTLYRQFMSAIDRHTKGQL